MTYLSVIIAAAKAAKISASLLVAICTHESNLTNAMVLHDGGSPSYGVCQVKYDTAKMLGFKGKPQDLMNVKINATYAAKYVAYQTERYGDNWCKVSAAYNAGSFIESAKMPGHPRNLKYVYRVKKHLEPALHYKMSCVIDIGINYAKE
jgi:soluble lytic murein transglycosylase-like protein